MKYTVAVGEVSKEYEASTPGEIVALLNAIRDNENQGEPKTQTA